MTLTRAVVLSVVFATIAGLVAWWLPTPSSVIGTVAVGASAGLAVLVVYLWSRLRNDEARLARIEELLTDEVNRGR